VPYKLTPSSRARKNAVSRAYYARNKELILTRRDASPATNKEARRIYMRGWQATNKERLKEYHRNYMREYTKRNPGKWKTSPSHSPENRFSRTLREKYKLTVDEYNHILEAQMNGCALCRREFTKSGGTKPNIDHDHTCCSGRYTCGQCLRGVLCHDCNTGLGKLGDSKASLMRAVEYVSQKLKRQEAA